MQFALSSRNQFDGIGGLALACYTKAHAQYWYVLALYFSFSQSSKILSFKLSL